MDVKKSLEKKIYKGKIMKKEIETKEVVGKETISGNLTKFPRRFYHGTFSKSDVNRNEYGKLKAFLILVNVRDKDENLITNKLILDYRPNFRNLNELHKGDVIKFKGRPKIYFSGYFGSNPVMQEKYPVKKDYKITVPSKVELIEKADNLTRKKISSISYEDFVELILKNKKV